MIRSCCPSFRTMRSLGWRVKTDPCRSIARIDQKAEPSCGHLCFIASRGNKEICVVKAVHTDIAAMGKVNLRRRIKLVYWYRVQVAPRSDIVCKDLFDLLRPRLCVAFLTAKDVVEDFRRGLIFVFMGNNLIPTLPEVIACGTGSCLEGRYGFFLLMPRLVPGNGSYSNTKEAPGNGLPGAQLTNKLQIIFLKCPAGIRFLSQFFPNHIQVPIDICPFGECLDLDFDRRYFEIADKGVNNAPLFPGASQKKLTGMTSSILI